ncbi:uncharacterized protein [Diadema antillarum]|uniref:uncharacterized protein n=1 Tax=Diadema antillarum TaxID=105358 RepID=UPI003A8A41E1
MPETAAGKRIQTISEDRETVIHVRSKDVKAERLRKPNSSIVCTINEATNAMFIETDMGEKERDFEWTLECQTAFDVLKDKLTSAPILAYPNIGMMTSLLDPDKHQHDWDKQLPYGMHAYRSSVQESTGESPAMMLGRELFLPVDVLLPPVESVETEDTDYAKRLRDNLTETHERRARDKLKLSHDRQTRGYDRNTQLNGHNVGDWVWLSGIPRKRGVCPKLVYKWDGPFLVTHKLSDVVYRIRKNERSQPKVVHLHRLKLYCGPRLQNWLNRGVPKKNPVRSRRIPEQYLE